MENKRDVGEGGREGGEREIEKREYLKQSKCPPAAAFLLTS
jgi:hypothetical protein